MPYKSIGKEYPFKTPAKVPMDFLMEPKCLSGFVGYQSVAASTTQNIDAISLNAVRSAIEARGKVKILFMKLSWNVGAQITDLVFGAVWVTNTGVTAQAVLESVSSDLWKVLKDLFMIQRQDFDAYIDGAVAYEHIWDWSGETEEVYTEKVLGWETPTNFPYEQVLQAAETTIISRVTGQMNTELAAYKPQISKIEPHAEITTTKKFFRTPMAQLYTEYYHRLKMSAKVYFTTKEPITEPMMGPKVAPIIIAALIKIIIALAVICAVALVVYYAWATFVQSMVVKKSTVTTKTTTTVKTPIFDEEGNIIGYEEKIIEEEKTEETVEPTWTGQLAMVAAIIAAAIVGAAGITALARRRGG